MKKRNLLTKTQKKERINSSLINNFTNIAQIENKYNSYFTNTVEPENK